MVAVFRDDHETIVVGLDDDNNPIDQDGTLFGSDSGRDISTFERYDFDPTKGHTIHIESIQQVRVRD